MKKIFLIIYLVTISSLYSDVTVLKYFQTDTRYSYRIALLTLAMEKTLPDFGQYIMEPAESEMTQSRGLVLLKDGIDINIASFPTNRERESLFTPVKIPILRGILAYSYGSFKKLFLDYHRDIIEKADLENRKIYFLKNATLPVGTAEPDTSWWLLRH